MEFLDKIPLDQTALTIAMVAVVLLFAVVGILKGIVKTILTLLSLTIAAAAFLFGLLQSPPHIEKLIPEAAGWMPLVAGAVCGLLTLAIIHVVGGIFSGKTKLPGTGSDGDDSAGKRRSPLALIFGVVIGLLVLDAAITGLRYFGTQAELEHLQTYVKDGQEAAGEVPLIVKGKKWLDRSPIATLQEKIDFLNHPDYRSRLNLTKLLIIAGDGADLATALQETENREVFKIPEIKELTTTATDLREMIAKGEFDKVYDDPRFQRLTTRPSTKRELLKVNLEKFFPTEDAETPEEGPAK